MPRLILAAALLLLLLAAGSALAEPVRAPLGGTPAHVRGRDEYDGHSHSHSHGRIVEQRLHADVSHHWHELLARHERALAAGAALAAAAGAADAASPTAAGGGAPAFSRALRQAGCAPSRPIKIFPEFQGIANLDPKIQKRLRTTVDVAIKARRA